MIDLSQRIRRDERMDDPDLDPAVYAAVLKDLARVNAWTFTHRATLAFLEDAAAGMPALRLLDVGFGQGDMLRAIAKWAGRRGIAAHLVGVDLNPNSAAAARAATPAGLSIDYRTGDYAEVAGPFDFVVSSLVAHHMSDAQLDAFLRFMEAEAREGWLVNDLHRLAFSYHGFGLLARMIGAHRIVREDGRTSIARSFRPADWCAILDRAGLPDGTARIVRRFPFRLCIERRR
jgi:2-polyprenyl-3-methyl-5-hydroxy-6-metoxy-1,4-benzoquinol methylase